MASICSHAQDYKPTRNFELKSQDGPTTRKGNETYDGRLSEREYQRRREEYLRKFRENHTRSEYEKEKERLGMQAKESELNKEMQEARERERERKQRKQQEEDRLDKELAKARKNERERIKDQSYWPQEWREQEELKNDLKNNPVVVESLEKAFQQNQQQEGAAPGEQAAPQVSRQQMLKELQGLQDKIKSGDVNMEDVFNALNKASGGAQEQIDVPAKYQGEMAEQLYKSLHQVRSVPPDVLNQQLRQQLRGHPLEGPLTENPSILPKAIEVMQDPEALPDASLMLSNREKLFLFALINLALFVLGIFLKRKIRNSNTSWSKGLMLHIGRWVSLSILSLCAFTYLFGDNLQALWRVLMN